MLVSTPKPMRTELKRGKSKIKREEQIELREGNKRNVKKKGVLQGDHEHGVTKTDRPPVERGQKPRKRIRRKSE